MDNNLQLQLEETQKIKYKFGENDNDNKNNNDMDENQQMIISSCWNKTIISITNDGENWYIKINYISQTFTKQTIKLLICYLIEIRIKVQMLMITN